MKKSLLVAVLSILLLSPLYTAETAEDLLTHARTYNWLARAKTSNSRDFLRARAFAVEALEALENRDSDSAEAQRILIERFIADLDNRYENNFDNIVNEVPLFPLFTRRQATFEFQDDPAVVATGRALQGALAQFPPFRLDLQYDVVVVSLPNDAALEDEIRYALGTDTRFFPRGDEDILTVLNLSELESLSYPETAPDGLTKLARAWNKRYLLYTELHHWDSVDDVVYYGIYLRVFDADQGIFVQSVYSDGFAQDRLQVPRMILVLLPILLALLFLSGFLSRALVWFHAPRQRGSHFVWSGLIGGVSGAVVSSLVILGLGAIAPDGDSLFITPAPTLWFSGLVLLLLVVPPLLTYILSTRIPGLRDRLAGSSTLGALFASALGGVSAVLFLATVIAQGDLGSLAHSLVLFLGMLVGGFILGIAVYQWFYEDQNTALVPGLTAVVLSILLLRGFLRDRTQFELLWLGLIVLLYVSYAIYLKLEPVMARRRMSVDSSLHEDKPLTLPLVSQWCREPEVYIDPSDEGDFLEGVLASYKEFYRKSLDDSSSLNHPFFIYRLTGDDGVGKTRTSREIGNGLLDWFRTEYGHQGKLLFGDCDEMNRDGSGVPFEPLAQAFHDLFSAGRFEPPSKRANKIADGLKQVGLESALGVVGLGALNSLMGLSGEGEGDVQSSVGEIAYTLSQSLLELSRQAPVVLVIDDLHFIDPLSEELLGKLIYNLTIAKNTSRVVLILTENAKEATAEATARINNQIDEYARSGAVRLREITQSELVNPSRFDELLIDSLRFENDSAFRLLRSIEHYQPVSILGVLQLTEGLIAMNGAEINDHGRVVIRSDFDFAQLPPPSDIQDLLTSKLASLTEQQKLIVECAAFVGFEFNAEVLAHVLDMDRLVLLNELRRLEDEGILHDLIHQDDVYAFNSNALAAAIRHRARITSDDELVEVPQVVREYNYRVALSLEKQMKRYGETLETLEFNGLSSLAKRSYAAGERMLDKAFHYNSVAAQRARNAGRYKECEVFASQALSCGSKIKSIAASPEYLEVGVQRIEMALTLRTARSNLEESINELVKAAGRSDSIDTAVQLIALWLEYIEGQNDDTSAKEIESVAEQLRDKLSDPSVGTVARLYGDLTIERVTDSDRSFAYVDDLLRRYNELDDAQRNGKLALRVYSEVLEDAVEKEIEDKRYDSALAALEEALALKRSRIVNDREGAAKMFYLKGVCLHEKGEDHTAIEVLEEAYRYAEQLGAMEYKIGANTLLGTLLLEREPERGVSYLFNAFNDCRLLKDAERSEAILDLLKQHGEKCGNESLLEEIGKYRVD